MRPLLKRISKIIPRPIRAFLKKVYWFVIDTSEALAGRDPLVPPRSMIFVGEGDFKKIGEEFMGYFLKFGNLRPDNKVLDVGSGIGRMAAPLTRYLSPEGEYYGFDIVREGIDWCKKNIASKYPNFHFELADIKNMSYNPDGKYLSENFKFPYGNEFFDFVFLTSVFTHMFPADVDNYSREIARVLKRSGLCLVTFFLLNDESLGLIKQGSSSQNFIYDMNGCFTIDRNIPENAIAYKENDVETLFQKTGLVISGPIRYGSWCGRKTFLSYQDIVVVKKN